MKTTTPTSSDNSTNIATTAFVTSALSGFNASPGVSYTTSFTNSSLSGNVLTVTHNLGTRYISVTIYDNNNNIIIPSTVTATSTNALTVDLIGLTPLTGTWNVICGTGPSSSPSTDTSICQGRLTLTAGTPVTTSDVTAATTVYFSPYRGSQVSLYSGGTWSTITLSELSIAVPSTTNTPFDIFIYNNSGTPTLETNNWTNTTTRATALALQDGIRVKSGDATRRYLGTGCTTGTSGQCEDSSVRRFLWNHNYRLVRRLFNSISTASWTYATAAWRSVNNSTANRVECVIGIAEELLRLSYQVTAGCPQNASPGIGIGEDSTTAPDLTDATGSFGGTYTSGTFLDISPIVTIRKYPAVGYHYYQALEYGTAAATTFYGSGTTLVTSGLSGEIQG